MTDARALLNEARGELARFSTLLDLLVGELDEADWRARPEPGEWAPVEIVCHLREALADFRARRMISLRLLGSVAPDRLLGTAERPGGGRLSGLDLLASWVAHDRLHLQQLAGTLARRWADRWAPLQVEYAGPIPYGARRDQG